MLVSHFVAAKVMIQHTVCAFYDHHKALAQKYKERIQEGQAPQLRMLLIDELKEHLLWRNEVSARNDENRVMQHIVSFVQNDLSNGTISFPMDPDQAAAWSAITDMRSSEYTNHSAQMLSRASTRCNCVPCSEPLECTLEALPPALSASRKTFCDQFAGRKSSLEVVYCFCEQSEIYIQSEINLF